MPLVVIIHYSMLIELIITFFYCLTTGIEIANSIAFRCMKVYEASNMKFPIAINFSSPFKVAFIIKQSLNGP